MSVILLISMYSYPLVVFSLVIPPISFFFWVKGLIKPGKNKPRYIISNIVFIVAATASLAFLYYLMYDDVGLMLGWFIGIAALLSNILFIVHIFLYKSSFKPIKFPANTAQQ